MNGKGEWDGRKNWMEVDFCQGQEQNSKSFANFEFNGYLQNSLTVSKVTAIKI